MKIKITNRENASSVFFENNLIPCNEEIDVPFSLAIKLSEVVDISGEFWENDYNPDFWKQKRFGFAAQIDPDSGYGRVSYNLIKYSKDYKISHLGRLLNISDPVIRKAGYLEADPGMAMVWHDQPRDNWERGWFAKNIAITPFETTRIPPSWIKKMNRSIDAVFVPSKQNVQAYKDSGLKIPIERIHWGIEPTEHFPLERNNSIFTFGHMGFLSIRKGTDVLVDAFKKAFPLKNDVALVCKTSKYNYHFMAKDPRVKEELGVWTEQELRERFWRKIDCFVFPSRGEGFGLTPLEAMATGIPVIVTKWSGFLEYMKEDYGWFVDYKMIPAEEFTNWAYKEECGEWADPSLDDLVDKLRYVYNHQAEAKKKGQLASKYIKKEWLWENKIKTFHTALEKHL